MTAATDPSEQHHLGGVPHFIETMGKASGLRPDQADLGDHHPADVIRWSRFGCSVKAGDPSGWQVRTARAGQH